MVITLNKPPTVNHLYGFTSRGGFAHSYVTKDGKQWFKDSLEIIHSKLKLEKPIDYKCTLFLTLFTQRPRDIDNCLKAVQDVLQKCYKCQKAKCSHDQRIICNDNLIYLIRAEKVMVKKKEEERVQFMVSPYAPEPAALSISEEDLISVVPLTPTSESQETT